MSISKKSAKKLKSKNIVSVDLQNNEHESKQSTELETLKTFNNYKILTVTLPPIPLTTNKIKLTSAYPIPTSTPVSITHPILFKKHDDRKSKKDSTTNNSEEDIPHDRSLFLVNLPADTTQNHLKRLFRRCGEIEKVVLKKSHFVADFEEIEGMSSGMLGSGGKAYVVFNESEGVEKSLDMKQRKRVWSDELEDEEPGVFGFELWTTEYYQTHPMQSSLDELSASVDSYIAAFEHAEHLRKQRIIEMRNQPDEDGFVTVVRQGKRNTNRDPGGATVTAIHPDEAKRLEEMKAEKKKKKELDDFYRFQMRETKRNQLADLRKKFEQDKKRIALLKANRKFKPY
ncbi:Ribosomal RNA-processing protein 7 A [Nowakowskiella sp. JEL0407]|nr:Ribosomal RNA-processing protein 7 A [Nowakowskiella sp. JEL0407]